MSLATCEVVVPVMALGADEAMDLFTKLKGMRILLIDDDEWIRDALSIRFEGEACELVAVETAEEALQILSQEQCDIIIVDYRLPGMNGLEFLAAILKSHPAAFKILATAYGNSDLVSRAKQLGIHDYIEKPFDTRAIEDALSAVISVRAGKALGSRGTLVAGLDSPEIVEQLAQTRRWEES